MQSAKPTEEMVSHTAFYPKRQRFQQFQLYRVYCQGHSQLLVWMIHRMVNLTFLVTIGHAVCLCALLPFLVACACSLFFNAARSPERSSPQVLIMLDSIQLRKWTRIGS